MPRAACIVSCVLPLLLVVCASALLVHCKVRVLSFGSGVCLSIAISCVPLHCKYAFLQCSCACGSGVTALVVVIPRISQVVGGFNLRKS